MHRILKTLAVLITTLACSRGAIAQAPTTIDLRAAVTLPAGAPVLLKQIATISGPDADRLNSIVILHADEAKALSTDSSARALSRDTLRATLDNAATNWARTLLRGGTTTITFTPAPASATATASTPAPAASTPSPTQPTLPPDPRALRTLIINTLAEVAGTTNDTVILRTDSLSAPDLQLLNAPLPAAWKCSIRVLGATPAGRTAIMVEAFDADRVALSRTLNLDALIRREVLVAGAGGIAKDQPISAADLRTETRTVSVTESARLTGLTVEQVLAGGTAAKRRIDAGKPILPGDLTTVKTAVVVKRGDDVQVSCLAGGILLKSKAKSLGTARDGELVQLQVEGSKKIISARMSGPGKAIVVLDPPSASATSADTSNRN